MVHIANDRTDAGEAPSVVTSRLSDDGATTTIRVLGNLADGAEQLLNRTIKRAARADANIVLDLSDCEYCDSTTLGLVVAWQRRLEQRFRLVLSASGSVRRIFEITGLSRRLTVTTQP